MFKHFIQTCLNILLTVVSLELMIKSFAYIAPYRLQHELLVSGEKQSSDQLLMTFNI